MWPPNCGAIEIYSGAGGMIMASLPKGIRVSFNNTPQAEDDFFTFGDVDGYQYLDVLANDSGGDAKALWSVDQSNLLVETGIGQWVTLASGARVMITADGKLAYDYSTINEDLIQSLGEGDEFSDTFHYSIRLGSGAISEASVSLTYVGENDAATITGDVAGTVVKAAGGVAFAPAALYTAGNYVSPNDLHLADVNGDGHLDILTADLWVSDSALSLLLGDGAGGFGPRTIVANLYKPQEAVVADLNGDGNADVVATQGELNQLAILMGDGTGAFAPPSLLATGMSFTNNVELADLDGDGDLDIVAVGHIGGSINRAHVWLNDGSGNFGASPAATYTVSASPDRPASFSLADMDGDGDIDMVVGNIDSNTVSILRNNGDATFAPYTSYVIGGGYPNDVAVGDLNGDGMADVVTANVLSNTVSVLLNDGLGGLLAPATYATTGSQPAGVTLADLDGDGDLDIAVTNSLSSNLSVLTNDGNGSFGPATTFSVGTFGPQSIAAADLDGDGRIDLITANSVSDSLGNPNDKLSVLLNTSGGGGSATVAGDLDITDVDTGEDVFVFNPADLQGTYGSFTFDANTGAWTYTLDNADPDTQALLADDIVTDSLTVHSFDNTASATITVEILGSSDAWI